MSPAERSLKAGGLEHFKISLQRGVWGVQEKYSLYVINQISSTQTGDIIAFIGPGRAFPGRIDLKTWSKRDFKGAFEKSRLYRVTKGYYFDKTPVWPVSGQWKDEVFPHRFNFGTTPIINLNSIAIKKLSMTAKNELHSMVYNNLIAASPSTLVDLIFHSEQSEKSILPLSLEN